MQTRQPGASGLRPTLLGMGGFHLIETPQQDATAILNAYLDRGGNYIETATGCRKKIGALAAGIHPGRQRSAQPAIIFP